MTFGISRAKSRPWAAAVREWRPFLHRVAYVQKIDQCRSVEA